MAGKQAKILTRQQVIAALRHVRRSRYPQRDRVIILLSFKAGLRAGEIAKLTWSMLLDPDGRIANHIELYDRAAKKRSGRTIPLHPALRRELQRLRRHNGSERAVIRSERGRSQGMRAGSIVNWFQQLYSQLGLTGCSSHSGRRTFITNAARLSRTACAGDRNHGSGHDGSSKRSSDQARRPADRADRTNDRQGSDALPRTAGAPSESRSSSPRATSGSSVPGQSRAARYRYRRAAGERARPRGPRTDQSSAANDRPEHAFRVKIRRTGHPARPGVPPSSRPE